jgi:hypothetical protein
MRRRLGYLIGDDYPVWVILSVMPLARPYGLRLNCEVGLQLLPNELRTAACRGLQQAKVSQCEFAETSPLLWCFTYYGLFCQIGSRRRLPLPEHSTATKTASARNRAASANILEQLEARQAPSDVWGLDSEKKQVVVAARKANYFVGYVTILHLLGDSQQCRLKADCTRPCARRKIVVHKSVIKHDHMQRPERQR